MARLEIGRDDIGGIGGKYQDREEKSKHDKQFIRHTTYTSSLTFLFLTIMAAVRLRKAFRYPEESDGEREELDEEEQEQLIEQLQSQNDTRNAQYSVHISFSGFEGQR